MIELIGLMTARSLTFLCVVGAGVTVLLALWYLRLWGQQVGTTCLELKARWYPNVEEYKEIEEGERTTETLHDVD